MHPLEREEEGVRGQGVKKKKKEREDDVGGKKWSSKNEVNAFIPVFRSALVMICSHRCTNGL